MEQVTVTAQHKTRIKVVSISEIHQVIKTDEIPKAWDPLRFIDDRRFTSKAEVVWIYLMNLPTSLYISKPKPKHLTGLCGLEFDFVDEAEALCADLGKDSHVRLATVGQILPAVTAFVCIPAVDSFKEYNDYHDALRDEYRVYRKASESGKSHMHKFRLSPYASAVLNKEATPLKL